MERVGRFFEPPPGSFFLFGPRGTGKSHLLRERFPQALRVDLLDPTEAARLHADPNRLRERVRALPQGAWTVVDEVQRVPAVLDVVHALIEERPDLRFALTGSSARKLRRAGVNLLGGRAALRTLHPFMAAELGGRFSLESALQRGLVPLITMAASPDDALAAYAAVYLREEVQWEGLVRNIGSFARFLEALSFSQGSVLNVAEVSRECAVERKTVVGYLEIVEDLLLGFRVPVFTKRARRETIVHPKFYYFDVGVFRGLRPRGPLDAPQEIDGVALETLVAQQIRAWIAYRGGELGLFFWRTRAGSEVDFIVYGEGEFAAIEVKNGRRVGPGDLGGLRSFGEDYPEATRLLLHRGDERLVRDGVLCLPVETFLRALHPGRSLAEVAAAT